MKKILLTGTNGYIGKNLLPLLLKKNYFVYCCVRNKKNIQEIDILHPSLEILEIDFLKEENLKNIPKDIDAAYYFLHSLKEKDFYEKEALQAKNFLKSLEKVEQIIYLGGISNEEETSQHLASRKNVEKILKTSHKLTTLNAGIILGNGSASFEIMRDLVEKLPIMIAPQWILTPTYPISLHNVLDFLTGVLFFKKTYNQSYDISGHEETNYKNLLLTLAKFRNLKRIIITIPFFSPKLSSYWLYFITSTSFQLAQNLIDSLKIPIKPIPNTLTQDLNIKLLNLHESFNLCFQPTDYSRLLFNEKDFTKQDLINYIHVPTHGCFKDIQIRTMTNELLTLENIFNLGSKKTWYAESLWQIRGFIDKILGGVGFRKEAKKIKKGSSLNFWRVIVANKEEKRLLLYAEMKLPGEAWLEFFIKDNQYHQIATFRPKGLSGRLYWYILTPFHYIIFRGMAKDLCI